MKRFVIIDGSSLMYRAFYALPSMTNSLGEPTNAIVGFSKMLSKLLQDMKPDYLAIAFDKGKKTFRTERYAGYKSTRAKTPEELVAQIPLLHEFAAAFGISFIEKELYEADDIIGTLAAHLAAKDVEVMIVTGDKDALQLIDTNIKVNLNKKGISDMKLYDEAAFIAEYGFEPKKIIDLKGLMGDTSDAIPGVPGVGLKTATKLLLEYGSHENVFKNIDNIKGKKLHENLAAYQEQAILSKELATININVPDISCEIDSYTINPDFAAMQQFCQRYELNSVWQSFAKLYPDAKWDNNTKINLKKLECSYENWTQNELAILAKEDTLYISGVFAGKIPFEQLNGLAIYAPNAQKCGFIAANSVEYLNLLALLPTKKIVVFGLKGYYHAGISLGKNVYDVELIAYLLNPDYTSYDLTKLASKYLTEYSLPECTDDIAKAALNAFIMARIEPILYSKLKSLQMEKLYHDIELPLVEVLAAMEQNGVYINCERLQEKAVEVGKRLAAIEENIYSLVGEKFNINSPKQLAAILFNRLNLPTGKKTKTGYSTNSEVLIGLLDKHPVIAEILGYRMWMKLKSTYLDGVTMLINDSTGRLHTHFNQTVTATGRLSSSYPNLQNIPVRTEEGKTIRALFEPGKGFDLLLSADYSQIELRILAHLSGDERFIKAFCDGKDIHASTAAEVFDIPLAEVDSEHRRRAKAVNFGIVYGISDYGLAKDLHISKKEAAGYIDSYFKRYAGVKKFLDDTIAAAHKDGAVRTMFNRYRALPDINSRNFVKRSLAERMAMNSPIQGSAADIIKLAMISAYGEIKKAKLKSRIILQVHDELVLEVVNEEIEQVKKILHATMENVAKLAVPLIIDIHSGSNWAEAK